MRSLHECLIYVEPNIDRKGLKMITNYELFECTQSGKAKKYGDFPTEAEVLKAVDYLANGYGNRSFCVFHNPNEDFDDYGKAVTFENRAEAIFKARGMGKTIHDLNEENALKVGK